MIATPIIKKEPNKKEKLMREKQALEKELLELGDNVSESQVWHKKARIREIENQIKEIDQKKATSFNKATDKLKSNMQQKDMTAFNMQNSGERE
ncbi:MAG: hypothetical protein IKB59_01825 [Alphaproteobacteria bacterium]|nr:hypothetical protein [Alphaproteobacteria bacterium]